MKNEFLAKSNGETIMEHTENLISNLKKFFITYSEINVDKKLLLLACYLVKGKMENFLMDY